MRLRTASLWACLPLAGVLLAAGLVPAPAGAQSVSLTSQGRQVSILVGADAVLPPGFPDDVPVLPGMTLASVQQDGSDTLLLEFRSPEAVDAVAGHYAGAMAAAGWTPARVQPVAGERVLAWEKSRRAALLSVAPEGDRQSRVRLQLLPRKGAASLPADR